MTAYEKYCKGRESFRAPRPGSYACPFCQRRHMGDKQPKPKGRFTTGTKDKPKAKPVPYFKTSTSVADGFETRLYSDLDAAMTKAMYDILMQRPAFKK